MLREPLEREDSEPRDFDVKEKCIGTLSNLGVARAGGQDCDQSYTPRLLMRADVLI